MQPDSPPSSESGLSPSMEQRAAAVLLVDLRQAWPMLLVRAVLAVALGLVALIWPEITLVILAWTFGIYAAIDGITQIIDGIRRRTQPRWWLSLLLGLLGLVACEPVPSPVRPRRSKITRGGPAVPAAARRIRPAIGR